MSRVISRRRTLPQNLSIGLKGQKLVADKNHPHMKHCVAAYVPSMDFGTSSLTNTLENGGATFSSVKPTWETAGREVTTNGTSSSVDPPNRYIPDTFPFALRIIARHKSGASHNAYFTMGNTGGTDTYVATYMSNGDKAGCFLNIGGVWNWGDGTTTLVDGEYYDVMGVCKLNGEVEVYLNGVLEDTDSSDSLSMSGSTFNTIHLGYSERSTDLWLPSEGVRLLQVFHGDPSAYAMEMYQRPLDFLTPNRSLLMVGEEPSSYFGIDSVRQFIAET